jgi:transcriptional regulator with XRE-family HTH domain
VPLAAGLSLKQLGAHLGMSLQMVHYKENMKVSVDTEYLARALAARWPEQAFAA